MNAEAATFVLFQDPQIRQQITGLCQSISLPVQVFENPPGLLSSIRPVDGGCVVCETVLPGISGLELLSELRRRSVPVPVIFATRYADVESAVRAMKAGAFDYVEIPFREQELLERITRAIQFGEAGRRRQAAVLAVRERMQRLTPRELEVMELVVRGRPNKHIAEKLGVQLRTIELHRRQVMEKMEADSLAELVRKAVLVEEADSESMLASHHPNY